MHLFLKKIYRKNPFPKIYRINQCEVLINKLAKKLSRKNRMVFMLMKFLIYIFLIIVVHIYKVVQLSLYSIFSIFFKK